MPTTMSGSLLDLARGNEERIGTTPNDTPFLKGADNYASCQRETSLTDAQIKRLCRQQKIEYKAGMRARILDFIGSDATPDRAGDILNPKGWELDNYQKNPVFLWAHDYSQQPIGRAISCEIVDSKTHKAIDRSGEPAVDGEEATESDAVLKFSILFADTQMGKDVLKLYKGGFMSATSVGFIPKAHRELDADEAEKANASAGSFGEPGFFFEKNELLELSAVPVPCNPNAIGAAVSKGTLDLRTAALMKRLGLLKEDLEEEDEEEETPEEEQEKGEIIAMKGEISYRIRMPDLFDDSTWGRVTGWMSEPARIDLILGNLLESGEVAVQSARFPEEAGWNEESVAAFVEENSEMLLNATPPSQASEDDGESAPDDDESEEATEEGAEEKQDGLEATVHLLVFDPSKFTVETAVEWANTNGFAAEGAAETEDGILIEQVPAEKFDEDTFERVDLDDGVVAIAGALLDASDDEEESDEGSGGTIEEPVENGVKTIRIEVDVSPAFMRSIEELRMEVDAVRSECSELRQKLAEAKAEEPEEEPLEEPVVTADYSAKLFDIEELRKLHADVVNT